MGHRDEDFVEVEFNTERDAVMVEGLLAGETRTLNRNGKLLAFRDKALIGIIKGMIARGSIDDNVVVRDF